MGLSTLVFIVFPDALTEGFTGDDPNMKFYQRILDYLLDHRVLGRGRGGVRRGRGTRARLAQAIRA